MLILDIGYTTSSNGAKSSGGTTIYQFRSTTASYPGYAGRRSASVVKESKYSKGTTQYSDVTSTSKSTYPNGGASGSYWYVYKGEF